MSTNEALLTPVQTATEFPTLQIREGQFMFAMRNHECGRVERFLSAAAVREAFSGLPIDSGWLDPRIVRWGNGKHGEWCVAFLPPAVYELELTREAAFPEGASAEEMAANWKITSEVDHIKTPLPGLVFFGLQGEYYIWATKTPQLDPYQEIYRCPLPNVEADGKICWGPFKPPRCSAKGIFEAFELFIKSTFNNHRANGKSKQFKDDVRLMLADLTTPIEGWDVVNSTVVQVTALPEYPVDDLIRQVEHTGVTLDKAIRGFFENGEMPS